MYAIGLRCLRCGREYGLGEIEYVCACRPNVGSDLGTLDVVYDYAALGAEIDPARLLREPERSLATFAPLLPIQQRASLPPLPVGNTPLIFAGRLAQDVGLAALWVKDDGRNPSGSLKDRASALAVARAREAGAPIVATASTGNAAAALAAMSAAVGQANVIFVPRSAPPAKLAQLLVFGSRVLAIDGNYDQAFDLCIEACAEFGWYNRNTGYNPYMTEGKKTVVYEIAAQLAARPGVVGQGTPAPFAAPDAVFVSVGDGCILGGVHKGFKDLVALGWVEKMPRLYGVQSTASDALYRAWMTAAEVPAPITATTRADSISVDAPRDAVKALAAVRESGGAFVAVDDDAILAAILPLARKAAVFAEPAGAAAYAGLLQAVATGLVGHGERVVVINTGNGLKDVPAAIRVAGDAPVIEPTLGAVRAALPAFALS